MNQEQVKPCPHCGVVGPIYRKCPVRGNYIDRIWPDGDTDGSWDSVQYLKLPKRVHCSECDRIRTDVTWESFVEEV